MALAAELAGVLRIRALTARILIARGFSEPEAAAAFLRPTLEHLHDPYRLTGMGHAVARLRRAIEARETILIYGDYDVDGVPSVVILKKAIELAGGVGRVSMCRTGCAKAMACDPR